MEFQLKWKDIYNRGDFMKKKLYFGLSIFFGFGTIASVFQSKKFIDQLGTNQFFSNIVFGLLFAALFYYLYNKKDKTNENIQTEEITVITKHDLYENKINDSNINQFDLTEIERNKIKEYKFKNKNSEIGKFIFAFILFPFGWIYLLYRLVRHYRKQHYFLSDEFITHKIQINEFVKEYNEIAKYVEQFETISLQSDSSDKYKYAHVATGNNTSSYNIQRNRNKVNHQSIYVHNASLQVVRNAELEPFKYLCKYFDFKPNEENLQHIQNLGEQVSRFLNAKRNLDSRYHRIMNSIQPPRFILKYYKNELLELIEVKLPHISFKFPTYTFQYVSAGGNSSQTTSITLNEQTIELLIEYMDEQVKYKKSAKAQRSLMTKKLREYIKRRDNYTCQSCSASTAKQDLLLLEVDHIIPVAKGGLSTEDNLQTLCWKCNRTKSDKILSV